MCQTERLPEAAIQAATRTFAPVVELLLALRLLLKMLSSSCWSAAVAICLLLLLLLQVLSSALSFHTA